MNKNDNEIIEELELKETITKNRTKMTKTYTRARFAVWAIIICNFLAGCFIGFIYFLIDEIICLIIGIVIILLIIPTYLILNKIMKKLQKDKKNAIKLDIENNKVVK
jgi:undecaprenyl pyrophosphate phosphatase UppP